MTTKNIEMGIDELLSSLQQTALEADTQHIPVVYIDIHTLVDYPLTKLLAIAGPENYKKFRRLINTYANAYRSDRLNMLIELTDIPPHTVETHKLTAEEVRTFIQTKDTITRICDEIYDLSIYAKEAIKVKVFTDGQLVPGELIDILKQQLSSTNVEWTITDRSISDITVDECKECGSLFVYDYEKLHNTSKGFADAIGTANAVHINIYTHRIITQKCEKSQEYDLLRTTEFKLGFMFRTFEYITMRLTNSV